MAHWTDKYVGMPYAEDFDCVHLLVLVQHEVFKRELDVTVERESHVILKAKQLEQHKLHYLDPILWDDAVDGDVVLMKGRGRLNHTGILAVIHGIRYVLHNVNNLGHVILTRIHDLDRIGLELEGYYRCKTE